MLGSNNTMNAIKIPLNYKCKSATENVLNRRVKMYIEPKSNWIWQYRFAHYNTIQGKVALNIIHDKGEFTHVYIYQR